MVAYKQPVSPGPGLGDPRRQRRRRDAHAAHPRPGRGGRPGPRRPGAHLYRTTGYFLERIGVTSLDDLPELAPYLPDLDDLEDELDGLAEAPSRRRPSRDRAPTPDGGIEPA